jgi:hypothetical protein
LLLNILYSENLWNIPEIKELIVRYFRRYYSD